MKIETLRIQTNAEFSLRDLDDLQMEVLDLSRCKFAPSLDYVYLPNLKQLLIAKGAYPAARVGQFIESVNDFDIIEVE